MPDLGDVTMQPGKVTLQSQQGADLLLLFLDDLNRSLTRKDPPRNRLEDLLEVMEDTLGRLGEISDGPVHLTLNGWRFCLGWRQVVVAAPMRAPVRRLSQAWNRLGIGRMSFPRKVTVPQLRELAVRLKQAFMAPDQGRQLFWDEAAILVEPFPETPRTWDVGIGALPTALLLNSLIQQGRKLGRQALAGERLRLLPLRRLLLCAVERLKAGDQEMFRLLMGPDAVASPETHPALTALLAVRTGLQLRLPPGELLELGTAAMLHGMIKVHGEQQEEGEELNWLEQPGEGAQRFTFSLVQSLARTQGLSAGTLSMLVALHEAQLDFCRDDLYPRFGAAGLPHSLHGQIIALSAMISLYVRSAVSADSALMGEVLSLQLKVAGKIDPALIKACRRAWAITQEQSPREDPVEERERPDQAAAEVRPAPPPAQGAVALTGRAPRVLLVDDEADIRLSLRVVLEEVGFKVSEAEDGMWAAQKLKEEQIDLMILDVMMPHMDGYDLLRSLGHERLQSLPVIILSARNQEREVDQGLELGASRYLVKPFEIKVVLGVISELIMDLPPEQGRRIQQFISG